MTTQQLLEQFAVYHFNTDIATFKYHRYRPCTNRYAAEKYDTFKDMPLKWFMNLDNGNRKLFIEQLSRACYDYEWSKEDLKRLNKKYHHLTPYTALELADRDKDLKSFEYILDLNPIGLTRHLEITRNIFKYNYYPFHLPAEVPNASDTETEVSVNLPDKK